MKKQKAFLVASLVLLLLGISAWQCGGAAKTPTPAPSPSPSPSPTSLAGYDWYTSAELGFRALVPSDWEATYENPPDVPVASVDFASPRRGLDLIDIVVMAIGGFGGTPPWPIQYYGCDIDKMCESIADWIIEKGVSQESECVAREVSGHCGAQVSYRGESPFGGELVGQTVFLPVSDRMFFIEASSMPHKVEEARQVFEVLVDTFEVLSLPSATPGPPPLDRYRQGGVEFLYPSGWSVIGETEEGTTAMRPSGTAYIIFFWSTPEGYEGLSCDDIAALEGISEGTWGWLKESIMEDMKATEGFEVVDEYGLLGGNVIEYKYWDSEDQTWRFELLWARFPVGCYMLMVNWTVIDEPALGELESNLTLRDAALYDIVRSFTVVP